ELQQQVVAYGDTIGALLPLRNLDVRTFDPKMIALDDGEIYAAGVGQTTITVASQGDAIYFPFEAEIGVKIIPRQLVVTCADTFKTYGDPDPTFEFMYEGFVGGDGPECLEVLPRIASSGSNRGAGVHRLHP